MGLSSNIIWHQGPFESIRSILQSKQFMCSYSVEKIKWRRSELEVAFPMVSFCDLPLSDMHEYLTHIKTGELTGKYGECTIGLSSEWAYNLGMSHVWYLDYRCNFLREILPSKSDLLKSLKSLRYNNRWHLLSRIKPFKGSLETKGFIDYRFYDEKEVRYIPSPQLLNPSIKKVLSKKEYEQYKILRQSKTGKPKGDSLIPEIVVPFELSDVRYILCSNEKLVEEFKRILSDSNNNINLMTYPQIVEEIIGTSHSTKKS